MKATTPEHCRRLEQIPNIGPALTRFMPGDPARPWWHYTPERKRALARRSNPVQAPVASPRQTTARPPKPARQT